MSTICIDGLVQERRNSIALAMELRLSCTKPLILSYLAVAQTVSTWCNRQDSVHNVWLDYHINAFWLNIYLFDNRISDLLKERFSKITILTYIGKDMPCP